MTCGVPTEKVNPAPTFSASLDGLSFDGPQSASVTGAYYQGQSYLDPGVGGEYQVTCRMTNTVLNSWQEKQTKVNVIGRYVGLELNLRGVGFHYFTSVKKNRSHSDKSQGIRR